MAEKNVYGIIGGSGFYELEGLRIIEKKEIDTPYGRPSAPYVIGEYDGKEIIFLTRHGINHQYSPTNLPYQANIYGMKLLGVNNLISFSAVGSLQEKFKPGDFVIIDQFFDRTKHRIDTFFNDHIIAHIPFSQPTCPNLRKHIIQSAKDLGVIVHDSGTYVCMEGPAFSTYSESIFYKNNGFSVIGMTNLTEAKLAREAEICYATVSMITDYDCWKEDEETVSADLVLKTLKQNESNAIKLLKKIIKNEAFKEKKCNCENALEHSIICSNLHEYEDSYKKVSLLIDKYYKK